MSIRVNLLRPEEIRNQGSLERGSLVRGLVLLGSSAAVIFAVWAGFQYHQVIGGHARVKARWAAVKPEFERVKVVRDAHLGNQAYLQELNSWTAARIRWTESLDELQALVPPNIQLTRMVILGETKESEAEPKTKDKPGTPARRYQWRLEGQAEGDMSDQDVIRFVDALRSGRSHQEWLASVKLQGLQRVRSREVDDSSGRSFRIDASSHERLVK